MEPEQSVDLSLSLSSLFLFLCFSMHFLFVLLFLQTFFAYSSVCTRLQHSNLYMVTSVPVTFQLSSLVSPQPIDPFSPSLSKCLQHKETDKASSNLMFIANSINHDQDDGTRSNGICCKGLRHLELRVRQDL